MRLGNEWSHVETLGWLEEGVRRLGDAVAAGGERD